VRGRRDTGRHQARHRDERLLELGRLGTQRTFNLSPYAGQTVVLWFNVHDDNCPSDPSYMLVDDISIQ
jgi:hypothetical protein